MLGSTGKMLATPKLKKMNIDQETYDEIEQLIHSSESPVGIDAKRTHIIIIHKLIQIEKRLDALSALQAE